MFMAMASYSVSGLLQITMMYVDDVNSSMKLVNFSFLTTIDWN